MRKLIRGGQVLDGSGGPAQRADVLIEGDTILAVAPGIEAGDALLIDAAGKTVTPGFVDFHRHCDIAPLTRPDFGRIELAQGITSMAAGNCGLSLLPSPPDSRAQQYAFLEPILGAIPPDLAFDSYAQYNAALEGANLPVNLGYLAAAGAIKIAARGFSAGSYGEAALGRAEAAVTEAMEAGALGLSLGIMYPPEVYSTPDELVRVARPAARYGGVLTCHIRGEGDSLAASVSEVIDIGRRAGLPVNISHFKATGLHNWRQGIFRAIDVIENARARGEDVTADFYPYDGGASLMTSLIPPGLLEEGQDAMLARLATPGGKARLRQELQKSHPGWDNMIAGIGWERILLSSVTLPEHQALAGRPLSDLAAERGYDYPADLLADLLVAEGGKAGVILRSMAQEDVDDIARLPWTALISDALYGGGASPHPRLYGAFPRFIRDSVLARRVVDLPTAIHKMTGLPARRMGLRDRGLIRPGAKADIALFEPERLMDHATYGNPRQLSTGMDLVLVGGEVAFQNGRMPGAYHGRLLRLNR